MTVTPANTDTFAAALAAAKPGDTITLTGDIFFKNSSKAAPRTFDPPLIIDATAATMNNVLFYNFQGLTIKGGTWKPASFTAKGALQWGKAGEFINCKGVVLDHPVVVGPEQLVPGQAYVAPDGYGFSFSGCAGVTVLAPWIRGVRNGVTIGGCQDVAVTGGYFERLSSDGVDIGDSTRVQIVGNTFTAFMPGPAAHPDAVQLIANPTPGVTPSSDITTADNLIVGHTQGIGFYNHDRGGADRITILRNRLAIDAANGITGDDMRGSRVAMTGPDANVLTTLACAPPKTVASVRVTGAGLVTV